MSVTVTVERYRQQAQAQANGIAWVGVPAANLGPDIVAVGGWAEYSRSSTPCSSGPSGIDITPDTDQSAGTEGTLAVVTVPGVGTAAGVDGTGKAWWGVGFAATPGVWIVGHIWVSRVS